MLNTQEKQKKIRTKQCPLDLMAQRSLVTLMNIWKVQKTVCGEEVGEETEGESKSVKKLWDEERG